MFTFVLKFHVFNSSAVMIMFLFSLIIGIVTLAMLLAGVTVDRAVCYPLRHPDNSTVVDLIDDYISRNLKDPEIQLDFKRTLILCYQNQSIYNVLNLRTRFDIDNLEQKFDVSKNLDRMQKLLDSLNLDNYKILDEDSEKKLKNLSQFEPSINFDKFKEEVGIINDN